MLKDFENRGAAVRVASINLHLTYLSQRVPWEYPIATNDQVRIHLFVLSHGP